MRSLAFLKAILLTTACSVIVSAHATALMIRADESGEIVILSTEIKSARQFFPAQVREEEAKIPPSFIKEAKISDPSEIENSPSEQHKSDGVKSDIIEMQPENKKINFGQSSKKLISFDRVDPVTKDQEPTAAKQEAAKMISEPHQLAPTPTERPAARSLMRPILSPGAKRQVFESPAAESTSEFAEQTPSDAGQRASEMQEKHSSKRNAKTAKESAEFDHVIANQIGRVSSKIISPPSDPVPTELYGRHAMPYWIMPDGDVKGAPERISLEQLANHLRYFNPDILIKGSREMGKRYDVDLAKAAYKPVVSLEMSGGYKQDYLTSAGRGEGLNGDTGLTITQQLFDFGATDGTVRKEKNCMPVRKMTIWTLMRMCCLRH